MGACGRYVGFWGKGKTGVPGEKNLSEMEREPTNPAHMRSRIGESNPGYICGRRVFSPLRRSYSPSFTVCTSCTVVLYGLHTVPVSPACTVVMYGLHAIPVSPSCTVVLYSLHAIPVSSSCTVCLKPRTRVSRQIWTFWFEGWRLFTHNYNNHNYSDPTVIEKFLLIRVGHQIYISHATVFNRILIELDFTKFDTKNI